VDEYEDLAKRLKRYRKSLFTYHSRAFAQEDELLLAWTQPDLARNHLSVIDSTCKDWKEEQGNQYRKAAKYSKHFRHNDAALELIERHTVVLDKYDNELEDLQGKIKKWHKNLKY
jgi:hypothetical protein